jgi:hypothetical protein
MRREERKKNNVSLHERKKKWAAPSMCDEKIETTR